MQQSVTTNCVPATAQRAKLAWAGIVAFAVVFLMLGCGLNIAIRDNFGHGAGLDVFNAGTADPWQLFINLDLIAGLILMLAWILWRERGSPVPTVLAWSLLVLWWGNVMVACYILHCLYQANGDAAAFFMGRRATGIRLRSVRSLGHWPRALAAVAAILAAGGAIRGLISVGFTGVPAIGYLGAFGSVSFALFTFALSADSPVRDTPV